MCKNCRLDAPHIKQTNIPGGGGGCDPGGGGGCVPGGGGGENMEASGVGGCTPIVGDVPGGEGGNVLGGGGGCVPGGEGGCMPGGGGGAKDGGGLEGRSRIQFSPRA